MLLCRRILRAHIPHVHHRIPRHTYTRQTPDVASQPVPNEPSTHAGPILLERVLRVSRYSVPKVANDPKLVAKSLLEKNKHAPFEAYTKLRAQDPSASASLPTDVLCLLAEGAVRHGSQEIVDSLAADVLDDHLLHEQQRSEVALALLGVPRRYSDLLDKQRSLSLLAIVCRQEQPLILSPTAAMHVMKIIVDDTTPGTSDQSLINFALGPFLKHITSLQPSTGAKAVAYRPPDPISDAYALIDKFVSLKRYHEAFQLFQTLSDHGHVPAEALLIDVPSPLAHDFAVILRSTLARACLHWDLHFRGVGFIASIMKSQDSLKRDLEPLVLELLHASLEKCSPAQFKACAWLMSRLVDPRCGVIIPTKTVHLFYSRAFRMGDYASTRVFYGHAQSLRVKKMKEYPAPRGAALTWLMIYLVERKHDVHLARCLAKQVVETSEFMPYHDRGRFIALAASQGFATEARTLWERYSVGYGHRLVVANAATMIRVVSLFAQRDSKTRMKMSEVSRVDEQNKTEFYRFARQVLGSFRESVTPLEKASHFDLSALARGYFMLGEMREGLYPLRVLIGRREIPDQYDINIVLSAMARGSPRAAYRMVDRMFDQGLRPDKVTFGTVLHEAIVQGDVELVTDIVERARKAGVSLSPKTKASLIQASVAVGPGMDEKQLRANVQHAWEVVDSTSEGSALYTPNLGRCCIDACLHLEDPLMAFKFWARLVRGRTEWLDAEQRQERRAIAMMVRRHCAEGRLDTEQGRSMLSALGDRGVIVDNVTGCRIT